MGMMWRLLILCYSPQTLGTLDDLQDLMDDNSQKVVHLHGNVEIPNSMIVTKDDYDNPLGQLPVFVLKSTN